MRRVLSVITILFLFLTMPYLSAASGPSGFNSESFPITRDGKPFGIAQILPAGQNCFWLVIATNDGKLISRYLSEIAPSPTPIPIPPPTPSKNLKACVLIFNPSVLEPSDYKIMSSPAIVEFFTSHKIEYLFLPSTLAEFPTSNLPPWAATALASFDSRDPSRLYFIGDDDKAFLDSPVPIIEESFLSLVIPFTKELENHVAHHQGEQRRNDRPPLPTAGTSQDDCQSGLCPSQPRFKEVPRLRRGRLSF